MKAVQISEAGQIELVERSDVTCPRDQVLLKIERVGFCGSDLAAFRGANPLVTYPRIPGHEIGATIAEIGADTCTDLSVGQQVLVIPYSNCGKCLACLQNRPNCCQKNETLGVQRDGAMCEYFAAPAEKVISAPQLSLAQLALVEPLSVGFHAVSRAQVSADETVGVIGCGAIGLGAIIAAHSRSARVIAMDIDDAKLEVARQCGATACVNSATENLHERLQSLTDGHGPHVMIEAVGAPACYRAAVEEVGAAGRVVYIGWAKQPVEFDTVPFVFKELDIRGSRNALPEDFTRVVEAVEHGFVPDDVLISRVCPLNEAPGAMVQWNESPGDVTRIHVTLDG